MRLQDFLASKVVRNVKLWLVFMQIGAIKALRDDKSKHTSSELNNHLL